MASFGYYVHKNTAWANAKKGDEAQSENLRSKQMEIQPKLIPVHVQGKYFDVTKTVAKDFSTFIFHH